MGLSKWTSLFTLLMLFSSAFGIAAPCSACKALADRLLDQARTNTAKEERVMETTEGGEGFATFYDR